MHQMVIIPIINFKPCNLLDDFPDDHVPVGIHQCCVYDLFELKKINSKMLFREKEDT